MQTLIPRFLAIAGLAAYCGGQSNPSSLKFEVASIKPCENGDPPHERGLSPNGVYLACVTTANLIRLAYVVFPDGRANAPVAPGAFQIPIANGPSWLDADRYTIDAKAEVPINVEMMKGPMMQALLEERFGLKIHREAKEIPAFEATVARDGPKLKAAKPGACVFSDRNAAVPPKTERSETIVCGSLTKNVKEGYDVAGVTMEELCRLLSSYTEYNIMDKTGISGTFDVHLDLNLSEVDPADGVTDPRSPSLPEGGPAVARALQKLGIRLRPTMGLGYFLVVDQVRRPSEN